MKSERLEMVGAGADTVSLTGSAQTTSFAIQPATGPAVASATGPTPGKTYLKIENVVSQKSHVTYEVYVNLPEGADTATSKEHYVGAMPLFGVIRASRPSEHHAGNGLGFSFDITELVNRLKAKNAWDDRNIKVTFLPRRTGGTAAAAVVGHDPIHVGRISLYKA